MERTAYGEITSVPRVGGSHHVLGVEHLLGEFRHGNGAVLLAAAGNERSEADHEEMETREGNQVDGHLAEVRIELTRELWEMSEA